MSSASALRVVAPTREELANDIRQHLPAMYLFQDSPEWLVMEVFGKSQFLPPYFKDLRLIPHPVLRNVVEGVDRGPLMVQANGRLAVRDSYGVRRDPRTNKPLSVGKLDGQDAGDIVIYAVDTYGNRGVVWLRGDETDEERMVMSRKLYSRHVRGWAEQERGARAEAVARFTSLPANKGRVPPPPTKNQIRAQEILDSQDSRERTSAHICTVCYGWEGDDFEVFKRHMWAAHKQNVTQVDDAADPKEPANRLSPAELAALEGGEQDPTIHGVGQPIIPDQRASALQSVREIGMVKARLDPRLAELEGARPVGAAPPEPVVLPDQPAPRMTPLQAAANLKRGAKQ